MKTLTTIFLNMVHQIYSINRIYLMALTALGIFNTSIAISQNNFCSGIKTYVTALGTVSVGSGQSSPYQSNSDCKFLFSNSFCIVCCKNHSLVIFNSVLSIKVENKNIK